MADDNVPVTPISTTAANQTQYPYSAKQSVVKGVKHTLLAVGGIAIVSLIGAVTALVPPDGGVFQNILWKLGTAVAIGLLSAIANWISNKDKGQDVQTTEPQKPV